MNVTELDLTSDATERVIEEYLQRRAVAQKLIEDGAVKVECPYCKREALAIIDKEVPHIFEETNCLFCGKPIMAMEGLKIIVKKHPKEE